MSTYISISQVVKSDAVITPGFSQARGTITGHISFGSGTAVQNAQVRLVKSTTEDEESATQFLSRYMEGSTPGLSWTADSAKLAGTINGSKPLTLQLWARPSLTTVNGEMTLLQLNNALELGMKGDNTDGYHLYAVDASNGGTAVTEFADLRFATDDFTHVAATYSNGTWTFYVGDNTMNKATMTAANPAWNACADSNGQQQTTLLFGGTGSQGDSNFEGYVDDVRLWSRALTEEDIVSNHTRILGGTESGLMLYWPLDEGINLRDYAFDIACQDGLFQLNHPVVGIGAVPSASVPANLCLYGVTDADGDYIIKGIPFQEGGTNYKIVPELGIHDFSPNTRSMFVSPTSLTANNIDFEDVSSFPMSGYIRYAGTNIPAEGIMFYVDGNLQTKDGSMATTDANGYYEISVPIGSHYVEAKFEGHTLVNAGRFPTTGTYDFNQALTHDFVDSTLINFVGRVAGGKIQSELPVGFGASKNNIGKACLQLGLNNPSFTFNCLADHITSNSERRSFESDTTAISSTSYAGAGDLSRYIYIETDPATDEFSAKLPPLKYQLQSITVPTNPNVEFMSLGEVDLTNVLKQITDTLKTYTEGGDSIVEAYTYNTKLVKTYYSTPTLDVTQRSLEGGENYPLGAYGMTTIADLTDDFGTQTLTNIWQKQADGTIAYRFNHPMFQMQDQYTYDIHGYEAYTNNDSQPAVTDVIPLRGQVLTIFNEMSSDQKILYRVDDPEELGLEVGEVYDLRSNDIILDANGKMSYTWKCGYPTLVSPYTRHFGISYKRDDRTYVWDGFDGIVLGSLPTGNNFVTLGPDKVTMVLRDPPGANSKTTWKTGHVNTKMNSKASGLSTDVKIYVDLCWGTELTAVSGIGFAIMSSAKTEATAKVGVHFMNNSGSSTEETWTTTVTESIATSSSSDYVGANGDVFIGASTNLVFGACRKVGLFRSQADGEYAMNQIDALTLGDSIRTAFMYTQQEIESNQIPNWKKLRNDLFIHVDTKEEAMSYPADANEPLYVTWLKEGDEHYGEIDYYNWIKPVNQPSESRGDSILWLSNQIKLWEDILAENEKDKVEAIEGADYFKKNISFDSGVSNTYAERLDTTYTKKHISNITSRAILGSKNGLWANTGTTFGINLNTETEIGGFINNASSDADENYKNWAEMEYSIADANRGVHLSINTYKSPRGWGDIFSVFGGQTYCPYEDEVVTKYYEKGRHILSAATQQMDKPNLRISTGDGLPAQTATVTDVPSGSSVLFKLYLSNVSDSESDMYYGLGVAEATDSLGLQFFVDGTSLSAGGRSIMIPAGTTVEKTLEVRQTDLSILDYEGLKLNLVSTCQNKGNGYFPVIKDGVTLNIHFMPTSSPIDMVISEPVLNVMGDSTVVIRLKNYNRQFQNLKDIGIEYRYEQTPQWTMLHRYVTNPADSASTSDSTLPDTGEVTLKLKMNSDATYPDGRYTFRAFTTTPYGNDTDVRVYSTEAVVTKDMRRPQALTTPTPTNGILGYGDDLSIEFNEDIVPGYVDDKNVIVTARLNEQHVNHDVALMVSPVFSNLAVARTVNPIFINGDFSFDMWMAWAYAGTIIQEGLKQSSFAMSIDDEGHIKVTIGSTTFTSEDVLPKEKWIYFVGSYNAEKMQFSALVQYDDQTIVLFNNQQAEAALQSINYSDDNYLYINTNNSFSGAIHDLSLFKIYRDIHLAANSKYQAKDNYVYGLANYWPMNEGHGMVAADTRHTHDFQVPGLWILSNNNHSAEVKDKSGMAANIVNMNCSSGDSYALELWVQPQGRSDSSFVFKAGRKDDNASRLQLRFDYDRNLWLDYGENTEQVAPSSEISSLVNDGWQHVALNVRRGQAASFYLNGKRTAVIAETKIPKLEGDSLRFGAGMSGVFDEIRLWKASISESRLLANMYNCIDTADVYSRGLVAYFPFEEAGQENGVDTRVPTMKNLAPSSDGQAINGNVNAMQYGPPLKNAPQETVLNATPVVSDRKVVINLKGTTVKPRDIEGTTLNITVAKIFDVNGNESLPIKWTAYVQQNSLKWQKDSININKMYGDEYTFDVVIENKSGATEYYTVKNLPQWLTLVDSETTDDVSPLSTKTLRFSVNPLVPIGRYDVNIVLQGNNEILEPLRIVMKVGAERPEWAVDASLYQHHMNIIGQVRLGGLLMENSESLVAAFINGECRGIASPQTMGGASYVTMTIFGDETYPNYDLDEPVTFRIWDALTGTTYTDARVMRVDGTDVDVRFAHDALIGSFDDPVFWTKSGNVEQNVGLHLNWNWMSLGVNPVSSDPEKVFSDYKYWYIAMKDQGRQSGYVNDVEWYGNIAVTGNKMYKLRIAATEKSGTDLPSHLTVTGQPLVLAETPITIQKGYTWIPYTPMTTMTVDMALAGINPEIGDRVKSQTGIAIYSANGWMGNLTALESGHGYVYFNNSNETKQFVYPTPTAASRAALTRSNFRAPRRSYFTPVSGFDYPDNMTMVIQLRDGDDIVDQAEVAAFIDGECRGTSTAIDGLYYLIIAGEGSSKTIEIRAYIDGETYMLDDSQLFSSDSNIGLPWEPYIIYLSNVTNAIHNVGNSSADDAEWYTLQGFRIGKRPSKPGVYIHRGEKVTIRRKTLKP